MTRLYNSKIKMDLVGASADNESSETILSFDSSFNTVAAYTGRHWWSLPPTPTDWSDDDR